MIQRLGRAGLSGLLGHRLQFVEGALDRLQFLTVAGAEVLAAGGLGDGFQGWFVEVQARVDAQESQGATLFRIGADTDRVDFHAFVGRQSCGGQRIDLAAVVGAIGDQNQHAALCRALTQAFEGQADGIADGGVLAGDADSRFVEPHANGVPVESQWRLQIGLTAEQDQADPVAVATFEKNHRVNAAPVTVG